MYFSYLAIVCAIASFMQADARIKTARGTKAGSDFSRKGVKGPGTMQDDVPCPAEIPMVYAVSLDEAKNNSITYNYDGTMFHEDGSGAGFVSVGCQMNSFLADIYETGAGMCVVELYFENEVGGAYIGTITAEGIAIFDELGVETIPILPITGGLECIIGKIGTVTLSADEITIEFK